MIVSKMILLVLLFLGSSVSGQLLPCGYTAVSQSRVIGGKDAIPGAWPWQIALLRRGGFICGGSLISDQWVVTAAHCVARSNLASSYKVVVGEHDRRKNEGTETTVSVRRIISHPNYNRPSRLNNDIALIQLASRVKLSARVNPVCLPNNAIAIPTGSRCYITGWGKIRHPGSSHHTLQQAMIPPVDMAECRRKIQASSVSISLTAQMLCAGVNNTRLSGCHGDSGGPYVCLNSDKRTYTLHGAVSWGSASCQASQLYTVFARVTEFLPWIKNHTGLGPGGGLSCDFNDLSICNFKQDQNDDFNWVRNRGRTPSSFTGPSSGNGGKGYYMYIEASSQRPGDYAVLSSPEYPFRGRACVTFYYHMYGGTIGKLTVTLNGRTLFSRSGNQGNAWFKAQVNTFDFGLRKVVFNATRGSSYTGDIAIDDVSVQPGFCRSGSTPPPATTSPSPPRDCNFDSPSICGYTQSTNDTFNWRRQRGSTPSFRTGPSSDHTSGSGYYMYIEASSQRPGDYAVLSSPEYPFRGVTCVTFYYHMYGATIGKLTVTLNGRTLFSRSGNQGNAWLKAQVNTFNFGLHKVVFNATRGSSFTGDIAIDDVSVQPGFCRSGSTPPPATTSPSPPRDCNFDSPSICGYTQSTNDTFNWRRQRGSTSSSVTGPSSDHTSGSGYYMYIETSSPRQPGDYAVLSSPEYPFRGITCVAFYYHMYGTTIGNLTVTLNGRTLFSRSGNQGNAWLKAQVNTFNFGLHKVVFNATRGSSFTGDIAIDDVSVQPGFCRSGSTPPPATTSPSPPRDCNFDSPSICGYTQSTNDTFNWRRQRGSTSSSVTGPSSDHTSGSGYYMYIETSSPRQPGDYAVLSSPEYPFRGITCVAFYYHMYGTTIGNLTVTLNGRTLFSRSGNQGNAWLKAQVNTFNFGLHKVVFNATRGSSFTGDIAIDDVSVQPGFCRSGSTPPPATTSPSPPRDCNFDSPSICGYTQSTNDTFNWRRQRGSTSSSVTGPSSDHTSGSGYYMYIETSSPRQPGDYAVLSSPEYPFRGITCVAFYYHMYGTTIGNLTVTLNGRTLFSRSGNQGNAWLKAQVNTFNFGLHKVVFNATRGSSFTGDIAIDDVSVQPGFCRSGSTPPPATTSPSPPRDCNFDSPSICGYTQSTNDTFNWRRQRGSTSSSVTGPSSDHTSGSGYYMYIETSSPRQPGDYAVLSSPEYPFRGITCVAFYYHMYGTTIGNLTVTLNGRTLFSRSGNQGNAWLKAQVNTFNFGLHKVVFNATRGSSFTGDIAIDDVSVQPGFCRSGSTPPPATTSPSPPRDCNFDSPSICGYTQSTNDTFNWRRQRGSTSSSVTGPSSDHTSGSGYYMYIETSSPRQPGDYAVLSSPEYPFRGITCVAFYYHMYGTTIGNLTVTLNGRTLFSRSGNQGNAWLKAQVNTFNFGLHKVVFNATRGSSFTGDIAIDDVSVQPGFCRSGSTPPPATTSPSPPRDCNFDSPSICGYTQSTNDTFNWRRQRGSTSSSVTGPSSDHTSGSGYYMYIETSSPRQPGDYAVLSSPEYPFRGITCVAFYYHMYGTTIGNLTVTLNGRTLFSRSGNQGNAWLKAQVNTFNFGLHKVVFNATRGSSFTGDIAIDDVSVQPGFCRSGSTPPPATTSPSPPRDCNFDSPSICGYTQSTNDTFNWRRQRGSTPSFRTGPSSDHTSGSGYYMYIEASSQRPGDYAVLSSPEYPFRGVTCVTFYYHMYGATIGKLTVTLNGRTLFSRSGNQGNAWLKAQVNTFNFGLHKVVFNATRGSSFTGDIAIDDVSVQPGFCRSGSTPPPATTSPSPPRDCNFDSPSICGYTQSTNDTFNWRRQRGSTPSFRTGPSSDHTSGSGYYMYIEASSQRPGDYAVLSSPEYPFRGVTCVTFYYHMYGATIGKLTVTLNGRTLFSRSGNQGNAWLKAQVNTFNFGLHKVVFNATRGSSFTGDIAIDDVSVQPGFCRSGSTPPPATTSPSPPRDCNFDSPSICGYTQSTNDTFNWRRQRGSTSSSVTGPSSDHTSGSGYYMYIETSSPRQPGDYAVLSSPEYPFRGITCVAFYYHMYGTTIGNLTVTLNGRTLFSRSGNQGNAWLKAQVNTFNFGLHKVVFNATVGSSFTGDIAIDDVSLKPGRCPSGATPPPATTSPSPPRDCNFDSLSICGYTQSTNDTFNWSRQRGSTSSIGTGPSSDHTSGSGYYMYIEASSPRQLGDYAVLSSPEYPFRGITCVAFYYHMYGTTIGNLTVTLNGRTLFSRSGNQGNAWFKAQVNTFNFGLHKVVFNATVGSSFTGDIAIDDVSLKPGRCPSVASTSPPPCTSSPNISASCGLRPHSRIVGGTVARPGSWPWQAMLLRASSRTQFCGGTLVSNRVVITAAHCVPRGAASFKIRLGAHYRTSSSTGYEQDFDVDKLIVHPSYGSPLRYSHDIAIAKLSRSALLNKRVHPACLPFAVPPPASGTSCWITGWGTLSSGGSQPNQLMQVSVPVVSRQQCDGAYPRKIHDSMICAGFAKGGKDTCQGDSGGPMVCETGGRYYLQGVTSWGYGCAAPGKYGVYARITYLLNWIKQEMANL
ncbi:MAM and LDL-receptor class A domain-containing protein 1-like isoform X4 [Acropora palmata]|uniref:MAM and LDL-receptor class A domain-containing protein 1-like isoform X4 n=1 Tax=Acropora palmata TaxID=6131 RepID=UPI003DA08815